MTDREKRFEESTLMLRHNLPIFALNVFTAVLLWLFAVIIYIPLAQQVFDPKWGLRLASLVSSIFLVAILIPTIKMIKSGILVADALSKILARKGDHYDKRYSFFRHVGYMLIILLSSLLTSTILGWIHPLFSGIVLIISIVLIFYHAFVALNAVSDVIIDKILFHS